MPLYLAFKVSPLLRWMVFLFLSLPPFLCARVSRSKAAPFPPILRERWVLRSGWPLPISDTLISRCLLLLRSVSSSQASGPRVGSQSLKPRSRRRRGFGTIRGAIQVSSLKSRDFLAEFRLPCPGSVAWMLVVRWLGNGGGMDWIGAVWSLGFACCDC